MAVVVAVRGVRTQRDAQRVVERAAVRRVVATGLLDERVHVVVGRLEGDGDPNDRRT